jgi:hypothetical protein
MRDPGIVALLRLDANHADSRPQVLGGDRAPRDQPSAPNGHNQGVQIGNFLQQLQRGSSLSGNDPRMIERRNQCGSGFCCDAGPNGRAVVAEAVIFDDRRTLRPRGFEFGARRIRRHHQSRGNSHGPRGDRYRLGVVPRGKRHHPAWKVRPGNRKHEVRSAPDLERSSGLKVFALKKCGRFRRGVEPAGMQDGRTLGHRLDAPGRQPDIFEGDFGLLGFSNRHVCPPGSAAARWPENGAGFRENSPRRDE